MREPNFRKKLHCAAMRLHIRYKIRHKFYSLSSSIFFHRILARISGEIFKSLNLYRRFVRTKEADNLFNVSLDEYDIANEIMFFIVRMGSIP